MVLNDDMICGNCGILVELNNAVMVKPKRRNSSSPSPIPPPPVLITCMA